MSSHVIKNNIIGQWSYCELPMIDHNPSLKYQFPSLQGFYRNGKFVFSFKVSYRVCLIIKFYSWSPIVWSTCIMLCVYGIMLTKGKPVDSTECACTFNVVIVSAFKYLLPCPLVCVCWLFRVQMCAMLCTIPLPSGLISRLAKAILMMHLKSNVKLK